MLSKVIAIVCLFGLAAATNMFGSNLGYNYYGYGAAPNAYGANIGYGSNFYPGIGYGAAPFNYGAGYKFGAPYNGQFNYGQYPFNYGQTPLNYGQTQFNYGQTPYNGAAYGDRAISHSYQIVHPPTKSYAAVPYSQQGAYTSLTPNAYGTQAYGGKYLL